MKIFLAAIVFAVVSISTNAQLLSHQKAYTHADTLRGSVTPERSWWDLLHYDLHVTFSYADSSIHGFNAIKYKVLKEKYKMQIDLMEPLQIDSVIEYGEKLKFKRDGNAYFVDITAAQAEGDTQTIRVYYHGKPRIAKRPPWDGGVIWARDKKGRPWISIACQGLGASVWYPCKDHQADEPDSAALHITAPDSLVSVGNGKLEGSAIHHDKHGVATSTTYDWVVRSPINNYNIIPYIGYYTNYEEMYNGEAGPLETSYWVLDYNFTSAQTHLRKEVQRMLKSLEHWFGPYPFYRDGYKIVDAPHLGMEHQSAIAYGNRYQYGYLGHDLSGSGWGMKWDFIVVHESAHEWFANNITTKELADMWVHESFANYSESLFTTSEYGTEAGNDYVIGTRKNIQNDTPIIGIYNVNEEGSGDMYYKGGNMIHMIRQIINDDEKFRQLLRGLNKEFYHKTVTTQEIENYISSKADINFSKVFDQYLRTTQIPIFNYSVTNENGKPVLNYSWTQCIQGFNMPIKVTLAPGDSVWLKPTTTPQKLKLKDANLPKKIVDRNFYVGEEQIGKIGINKN